MFSVNGDCNRHRSSVAASQKNRGIRIVFWCFGVLVFWYFGVFCVFVVLSIVPTSALRFNQDLCAGGCAQVPRIENKENRKYENTKIRK